MGIEGFLEVVGVGATTIGAGTAVIYTIFYGLEQHAIAICARNMCDCTSKTMTFTQFAENQDISPIELIALESVTGAVGGAVIAATGYALVYGGLCLYKKLKKSKS